MTIVTERRKEMCVSQPTSRRLGRSMSASHREPTASNRQRGTKIEGLYQEQLHERDAASDLVPTSGDDGLGARSDDHVPMI